MKAAFGDHAKKLAISSTKSMIGHALGAAGALEMVATVMSLREGIAAPTINYLGPDPECDLDYVPNQARADENRCRAIKLFRVWRPQRRAGDEALRLRPPAPAPFGFAVRFFLSGTPRKTPGPASGNYW